jgi:AAA family ATP:ADP antiporter
MSGMNVGVTYFIWIGIFNLMIVAQFWSFANDLYNKDEGERLFPIVGFGASLGAVLGAMIANHLIPQLGILPLLLAGAILLAMQLQITNYVDGHSTRSDTSGKRADAAPPGSGGSAFAMVFKTPYLLWIGLMILLLNTVTATGEYMFGYIVRDAAHNYVASGQAPGMSVADVIGSFYSKYFAAINGLGLLLQLFVVSRIIRYLGVPIAVAIPAVLSFCVYGIIAVWPTLWIVFATKVAENGTNYSLTNTVRNTLFLPCTREEKYSAKQAIDSFFVRVGDVGTAALVFIGTRMGLTANGFAKVTTVLCLIWIGLAILVGRAYTQRSQQQQKAA